MYKMDEDQLQAYNLAIQGHSLLITGQAGSGKTFVVKEIIKKLRQEGKVVAITSSTGIAATHFGELNATTLHKWGGLRDGRYSDHELLHLILTDETYSDVKDRLCKTDVLLIDEVSMVSNRILSQIEFICRKIRKENYIFGNIQLILCGDFYQLPPVTNELYGDFGHFCFESDWFKKAITHKINLHLIHRQDNHDLISAINCLEKGTVNDQISAFLQSLSRPMEQQLKAKAIHLFSRNLDADFFNYERLEEQPGEVSCFVAEDEGSQHYLNKMLAPKNLALKIGCNVMLLTNLSDKLVNGLMGFVTSVTNNEITVYFPSTCNKQSVSVKRFTFTTYDPVSKTVIAKRTQFPLKLCYGITIHKSQGMSLESVVVHCDNISFPGQLGVGVGRAMTVEGLQVINYKPFHCKQHSLKVYAFHENILPGEINHDLSCCRRIRFSDGDEDNTDNGDDGDNGDDDDNFNVISSLKTDDEIFSDFEEDILMEIDEILDTHMNNNINESLKESVQEFIDTPCENQAKFFQQLVFYKPDVFQLWYENQQREVKKLFKGFHDTESKLTNKKLTSFYTSFNCYLNSDTYKKSVLSVIKDYTKSETFGIESQILTSVLFSIQKQHLKSLSEEVSYAPLPVIKTVQENISPGGRGKIRYIAGYCVAKIKYSLSTSLRNKLFNVKYLDEIQSLKDQLKLLEGICCSESEAVVTTSDPESLQEIKRKQNLREGLTNVTDNVYCFFTLLDSTCWKFLSYESLAIHGEDIFQALQLSILNDRHISFAWTHIFTDVKITSYDDNEEEAQKPSEIVYQICLDIVKKVDLILILKQKLCSLFLRVCISQFRKDFLTHLRKEKGKALRKKVTEKSKKVTKKLDMDFILNDDSANKSASHYRLKAELSTNPEVFASSVFNKCQLQLIGKAYGLNILLKLKKSEIGNALRDKIMESDEMSSPLIVSKKNSESTNTPTNQEQQEVHVAPDHTDDVELSEQSTSTCSAQPTCPPAQSTCRKRTKPAKKSVASRKGKGKGKGKSKRSKAAYDIDNTCTGCGQSYIEGSGDDWICCDTCQSWFDRKCSKLEDDDLWYHYTEEDAHFDCPLCQ